MGTCASAPPDAVSPRGASSLDDVAVEVTTNPGQPTAEQPPQQPDARQGGGGSDGPASQQAQRAQRDQGGEQKGPLMLDAAVPAPPSLTAATATGGSSGDAAPHRRAAAAAAAPLHVFDFSVPILNTARGEVCNKYRMSTDGVYQVASPSSASSRATQPQDEHFSPRHDFQSHEDQGKTLYQANAEAIVEVITLAVREGRLPTRVQGHIWELCCCLGYLSCDCSRACTGKFQTVLEEFSGLGLGLGLSADIGGGGGGEGGGVVGGSRAVRPQSVDRSSSGSSAGGMGAAGSPKQPAAGELSLLRATSVPTQVVTQSERGRRKSLSQADVLRKQRQARARFKTKGSHFGGLSASSSSRRLGKARSGRLRGRGSGSGSGSDTNMGPPSAMRLESDTSETDDWDVGEDVQVAEEGEDMLAIIDEPFSAVTSAHNSPKKKLLHLQLLRAVRVAVETELLQAPDADAGGGGGGGAGAECAASTFAGSEPSTVGAGAGPPAAGGGRGGRGRQQLAQTCRCVGVVAEATGPLKYMEDRHVCLNADPFTVYKLGIGSEELTAVQQSPAAHNPVYEALYGVIDGHGGELVAESLFIDFPRLLVQHPLFRTDAKRAVLGTCETVDRRYVQQSVDVTMDQSGAVATFVLIRGNKLLCASVGDCRAVLSTSGGFAIALTHDHTLANSAERARVERTDAKISRGRIFGDLVVTRSFGDARHKPLTCHRLTATGAGAGSASTGGALRAGGTNCGGATGSGGGAAAAAAAAAGGLGDDEHEDDRYDYITALPEITSRVIQPSDEFLIMASDGLWDVFTSQAAVDYVRAQFAEARRSDQTIRAEDVARAAKKLIKEAQRKGSRDNVTVTIVCLWVRTVDPNLLSSSDSESDSGEADEIVEY